MKGNKKISGFSKLNSNISNKNQLDENVNVNNYLMIYIFK